MKERWKPVLWWHLLLFTAGLGGFIWFYLQLPDGFVPVLDHANLLIHEAGHIVFRILSETLGLYGGTLMQLLVPLIATISFWYEAQTIPTAIGGVWLCENLLNVARYMADARAKVLPLIGAGEHDWELILTKWNALAMDTQIAGYVRAAAWIGMAVTWLWLARRWRRTPRVSKR